MRQHRQALLSRKYLMFDSEVKRLIGEPYFSRGADYVRKRKVLKAALIHEDLVHGEVTGSGRRLYIQEIELVRRNGKIREIDGECTCPIGFNCKHVAAVLLAIQSRIKTNAIPRDVSQRRTPPVPGDLDIWLSRLKDRSKTKSEDAPAKEKLFYLIGEDGLRQPAITAYKVRLLKSGELSKSRTEYNAAQVHHNPKFMTLADAGILQKLSFLSSGYPRRFDWPDGPELFELLREITATGRARGFDLDGPSLHWSSPRSARFEWVTTDTGAQHLQAIDEDGRSLSLLGFTPPLYIDKETGACGKVETTLPPTLAALFASVPEVPAHAVSIVTEALHLSAPADIPRPSTIEIIKRQTPFQPVLHLFAQPVQRSANPMYHFRARRPIPSLVPVARLSFDYAGHPVNPASSENPSFTENDKLVVVERDDDTEALAIRKLDDAMTYGAYPVDQCGIVDSFIVEGVEENDLAFASNYEEFEPHLDSDLLVFTAEFLPQLRNEGWRIEIDESWPIQLYDGSFEFEANSESSGVDWFSFALTLHANGEEINFIPMITSIIDALPVDSFGNLEEDFDLHEFLADAILYPALEDGRLVPVSGEWLSPVVSAFLEVHGLTGFHLAEAGRAARLAQALEGCGVPWQGGQELLELGNRLRALNEEQDAAPPKALQAELRPYQRIGYGWLNALSETGFGGALTDDMGLGKTVQALALLVTRHLENTSDRPSLLVVPTSLVGNWQREASRFAPDLSMLVLHGPNRKEYFNAIPDHHVIITTYPLVHRDHETLFEHAYDLVILDEAQAIKNPATSLAKRIREVRSRQRIALTGTPMENNLIELWALFDWLIPGLLGNRANFTKTFRTPIEKHNNQSKQKLLTARLKPFLLRRTKEEVAEDLPTKTIIDEIVPLSDDQRRLYETLRVAMDTRVKKAIAKKGLSGSRITILDALLKLRQACCDPSLVKLEAARGVTDSAKRARLFALLEELVAEGRKVLIFSQFVGMLKLIEEDIKARGWGYAMLTGKTKKRDDLITKFQQGDDQLFLISLKAGGVGLNLTAADTVVLYDPWWNPAVERQAMDRVHRIGQTKPVFVYRMIAEGTVEAAIQKMQAVKQDLADALFDGDKSGPLDFGEDDITALFAPAK